MACTAQKEDKIKLPIHIGHFWSLPQIPLAMADGGLLFAKI